MAIAHTISPLFRSVMVAGLAVAGATAFGLGAAHAEEAAGEFETAGGATLDGPPVAIRIDGVEFGLSALAQMKRERGENRRVPRMLPLLATSRTANGQLWVGRARGRGGAPSSNSLRLDVCWTIPIGR